MPNGERPAVQRVLRSGADPIMGAQADREAHSGCEAKGALPKWSSRCHSPPPCRRASDACAATTGNDCRERKESQLTCQH